MAKEQFIDAVREVLRENDFDSYLEQDGWDEDMMFLIVSSTSETKKINALLKEKLKDKIDEYDIRNYDNFWIDYAMDNKWGFDDEYYVCSCCNKVYPRWNSCCVYPHWTDYEGGYIYCEDCVKQEYAEEYIDDLINDYERINTILSSIELEEYGFKKVNDEEYRNGLYGQCDSPKAILEKYQKEDDEADYLFSEVKEYNPYEIAFDLYKRERKGDWL